MMDIGVAVMLILNGLRDVEWKDVQDTLSFKA